MSTLKERIEVVDAVRGFALLGVLLANVGVFCHNTGDINDYAVSFYRIFILNNFYVIFSILFGLSFYLFMSRPKNTLYIFFKRILILLGIGLIHTIFFWHIDILHTYAITAFLLIFFYNMRMIFLKLSILVVFIINLLFSAHYSSQILGHLLQSTPSSLIDTYYASTYLENVAITWANLSNILANTVADIPHYLFLFLIGLYIGRSEIYKHTKEKLNEIYLASQICLLAVLVTALAWGGLSLFEIRDDLLIDPAQDLFNLALGCFYITFIVLLYHYYHQDGESYIFDRFVAVGKMTLTNYLSHSVLYLILFYDFNLGLHNELPTILVPLIALPVYFLQAEFSRYWIDRHGHGPMEKVWRYLTYFQIKVKIEEEGAEDVHLYSEAPEEVKGEDIGKDECEDEVEGDSKSGDKDDSGHGESKFVPKANPNSDAETDKLK